MFAQTEELLSVPGVLAFVADELGHGFAALLRDADTVPVEPIVAQITANVEFGFVVRRTTDAVQFLLLGVAFAQPRGRRLVLLVPLVLAGALAGVCVNGRSGLLGDLFPFAASYPHFVLLTSLQFRPRG